MAEKKKSRSPMVLAALALVLVAVLGRSLLATSDEPNESGFDGPGNLTLLEADESTLEPWTAPPAGRDPFVPADGAPALQFDDEGEVPAADESES